MYYTTHMKILTVLICCIIVVLAIYIAIKPINKSALQDAQTNAEKTETNTEATRATQSKSQKLIITQQPQMNDSQNQSVVIAPVLTTTEAVWKISTEQVVEWNTSKLPEGDYTVVAQLISLLTNQVVGDIGSVKAALRKQSLSYKVGTVLVGGDAQQQLPEGQYKIKLNLYKTPAGGAIGYGEYIESVYGNSVRVIQ